MSNIPEFTISELSYSIKNTLEEKFDKLYLKGEISGIKNWKGHLLFNLKDEKAIISSRIWQNKVALLDIMPEEGLEIIALGRLSTHIQRSSYNFIIENIKIAGEGTLLKLIEERKKKLKLLGYFDQKTKMKLPKLPKAIGIITSSSGAVIEDMKKCIKERFPSKILLWPVQVQGIKAEIEVSNAIKGFNNLIEKPDVLIIARGGGSIEDLMPFNSEKVAISIFNSKIPIVSAIGHETDFTISDLVADYRASTPTGAADLVVPEKKKLERDLVQISYLLEKEISSILKIKDTKYQFLRKTLINPKNILDELKKHYYYEKDLLEMEIDKIVSARSIKVKNLLLISPEKLLRENKIYLDKVYQMFLNNLSHLLDKKYRLLQQKEEILKSCSYERWLEKGFSIIRSKERKLIKSILDLSLEQELDIKLIDGGLIANIKKIQNSK